jgi:hypothetical protein
MLVGVAPAEVTVSTLVPVEYRGVGAWLPDSTSVGEFAVASHWMRKIAATTQKARKARLRPHLLAPSGEVISLLRFVSGLLSLIARQACRYDLS